VASETFNHSAIAAAARNEVWAALQKPETWEGIGGVENVHNPIVDADGSLQGFSFESVVGAKVYLGQAQRGRREEGRSMAWNIETSDIAGTVSVKLEDEGAGTRVDVTLEVESKGMLSNVFFPVISSTIGNGFPATVENFATSLG
jgi:carbon monoxide dehydrogenase subunit G